MALSMYFAWSTSCGLFSMLGELHAKSGAVGARKMVVEGRGSACRRGRARGEWRQAVKRGPRLDTDFWLCQEIIQFI
jgi:hypothetical protein